jgi:hypothetical protein
MKGIEYAAIIGGLALLWYLTQTQETFVPSEFVDKTNDRLTEATSQSSYAQQTNHMIPTPPLLEKVPGLETPFRVNMFNSFQPV